MICVIGGWVVCRSKCERERDREKTGNNRLLATQRQYTYPKAFIFIILCNLFPFHSNFVSVPFLFSYTQSICYNDGTQKLCIFVVSVLCAQDPSQIFFVHFYCFVWTSAIILHSRMKINTASNWRHLATKGTSAAVTKTNPDGPRENV